jgi:copper chaperone CopZ
MAGTIITALIVAIVVVVSVFGTVRRIKYGSACCGEKEAAPSKVKVKDKNKKNYSHKYIVGVDGMHCSGCVRKIENEFNTQDGVWAKANLEKRQVVLLTKSDIELSRVRNIVNDAGFTMLSFDISN